MALERSKGKLRPTLPRSSDLAPVETVRDPSEGRSAGGRFAPGNRIAQGQRWKAAIRKLLGSDATDGEAESLGREAWRMYLAILRDLPHDGASVRVLAALQAREAVLAARWANRALELGLDTPEGKAADELGSRHGQRAERLTVTCLDVATKLQAARPPEPNPWLLPLTAAPNGSARRRARRGRGADHDEQTDDRERDEHDGGDDPIESEATG